MTWRLPARRWVLSLVVAALLGGLLGAAVVLTGRDQWVQITVRWPEGSAVEVERRVAMPLEQALGRYDWADEVRSVSRAGYCQVQARLCTLRTRLAMLELGLALQTMPDLPARPVLAGPLGLAGRPAQASRVAIAIRGPEVHGLRNLASKAKQQLASVGGVRNIRDDWGPDVLGDSDFVTPLIRRVDGQRCLIVLAEPMDRGSARAAAGEMRRWAAAMNDPSGYQVAVVDVRDRNRIPRWWWAAGILVLTVGGLVLLRRLRPGRPSEPVRQVGISGVNRTASLTGSPPASRHGPWPVAMPPAPEDR